MLFDFQIKKITLEDKITSISTVIDQNTTNALQSINYYKAVTVLTSLYPPIQGIIRSKRTGKDPMDGSALDDWKKRLQSIFISQLKTHKAIYQIRYLDEAGKEMVRVTRRDDRMEVTPEDELQDKSQRYYFKEAQFVEKDAVYLSPVDLNKEHNQLQEPYEPTIRFIKQVFDKNSGDFKGMIVLNLNAQDLLNALRAPLFGESFVVNQDGFFIAHDDSAKLFGFALNHNRNYFTEEPELKNNIFNTDEYVHYDEEEKEYHMWRKVFYSDNEDQFWIVVHRFDEAVFLDLFRSWQKMAIMFLGVLLVIMLLAAWFLSDFIVNPILSMSRGVPLMHAKLSEFKISEDLASRNDEIGDLARSMNVMSQRVLESNEQMDLRIKAKTSELEAKMDELKEMNRVMVGREKRMIELKKDINELLKELGREPRYNIAEELG